jgi:AcrR family transcriptional regulator
MSQSDTAQAIVICARHLLDEGGAAAVSMRKVAQMVGVTAMAIYRHFPDHAALLNALADQGFADLSQTLRTDMAKGPALDRLARVSEIYLDFALSHPRLFELMFLASRLGARQFPQDFEAGLSPTANLFAEMVRQGMEEGVFRADEDLWEITFELGALLQGLVMLFLGGRIKMDAEGFRALFRRSLRRYIHGIHA